MTCEGKSEQFQLIPHGPERIAIVIASLTVVTMFFVSCSGDVDRVTRASMATKGTPKTQLIQALGPPSLERSITRQSGKVDVCAPEVESDRAIEYHVKTWPSIFGIQSISSAAVVCLDKNDRVISAHLEQF